MIQTIKNMLGLGPKADLKSLVQNGAVIVDVRTKSEYQSGHIKGSVNIPLQELSGQLGKLKKDQVIITCCASGMRSASARGVLRSKGFEQVHNGGGWQNLHYKISR